MTHTNDLQAASIPWQVLKAQPEELIVTGQFTLFNGIRYQFVLNIYSSVDPPLLNWYYDIIKR